MFDLCIKNATVINEGQTFLASIHIQDGKIALIEKEGKTHQSKNIIDASDLYLIPGVIDDQVHFREPGLTHKGDIYTESRAAAAGGVTSYMEMPNTKPQTIDQLSLKEKYQIAAEKSIVNYSFYIGATNTNIDELLRTDPKHVCGVKVFMGASTGNMLVDNLDSLKTIFSEVKLPVAVHSEDETIIRANTEIYRSQYGENIPFELHPLIRSEEACYKSTSLAVDLATKYNTRLHILHLSTSKELNLLKTGRNLGNKRITSEVCVHHLWFNDEDYKKYGSRIKWNPAIKSKNDQEALFNALLEDRIDIIATDHAPHTLDEKGKSYFEAPSGGPLVQHSLLVMLDFFKQGKISLERIVDKMCHAPADLFNVSKRGYIREGYWADLVLIDMNKQEQVNKNNLLYKCGWSPFEGHTFNSKIHSTIVNGVIVYYDGKIIEVKQGLPLEFER